MRSLLTLSILLLAFLLIPARMGAQEKTVITCVITAADPPFATVVCDGRDRKPFRVNFQLHSEWHFKDVKYFEGKNDEWTAVVVDPDPFVGRILKATEEDVPIASCQTRINRRLLAYQVEKPGQIAPNFPPPADCGELSLFIKSTLRKLGK